MQVKTIILAPDCKLSDEELMQDNETIANPTNKKIKTETAPKMEQPCDLVVSSDHEVEPNTIEINQKVEDCKLKANQPTQHN